MSGLPASPVGRGLSAQPAESGRVGRLGRTQVPEEFLLVRHIPAQEAVPALGRRAPCRQGPEALGRFLADPLANEHVIK